MSHNIRGPVSETHSTSTGGIPRVDRFELQLSNIIPLSSFICDGNTLSADDERRYSNKDYSKRFERWL